MADNLSPGTQHTPVHETVYQKLRGDLMAARLAPGSSMTLRSLATRLGVSPTPVREAVRRLIAEKALQWLPNRRISIPAMTADRFEQLLEARAALEVLATRRAVPLVDNARLSRLSKLDAAIDRAAAAGRLNAAIEKNREFHMTLYRAAPCDVLIGQIESLWLQFGPYMHSVLKDLDRYYPVDRHREALEALRTGDAEAACRAIEADVREGMGALGGFIEPRAGNHNQPLNQVKKC